ncbi:hypothetical protein BHE74_00055487 [Ensete ventricosum]|nr:hypothetical protein BHE74_00055487 [Ensete ventricosum]
MMTCASFPSQTLSPTLGSKSPSQSSSAACVCLHFVETNQKRGHYLRGKPAISRSSTRLLPWVPPLCARKPPPRGERPEQEQMAPSSPLSDLIHRFYSSVNEKELSRLQKLLSKDCIFEGSAYSKPFQGKKKKRERDVVLEKCSMLVTDVLQANHASDGTCDTLHRFDRFDPLVSFGDYSVMA